MEKLTIELNEKEKCDIYGGQKKVVYTLDEHGNVIVKWISI